MKKFFLLCLMFVCLYAQTEIPPQVANFVKELEVQKNNLQGGAVAILYKGQVVYKITFGNQRGDNGAITPNTMFPLASVSKVVSAMAVALLVDKGTLNLYEKFKLINLKHPVNLANILSHTTGYQFSGNAQIEQGIGRAKLVTVVQRQQPKGKPGEVYKYSNTMFSFIDEALNANGLSLGMALENLRSALGTKELQILPLSGNEEVAYPHTMTSENGVDKIIALPFPPHYPRTVPASAGVFASLDGMIKLFKLCFGYRPDLVSKQTLDTMYKPVCSNDDCFKWNLGGKVNKKNVESLYALGWRVLVPKKDSAKRLIFHSGYINGISSFIGFMPSEEIGIIFLSNQRTPFPVKSGIKVWENCCL